MKWIQADEWVIELENISEAILGQGYAAECQARAMDAIEEWLG